MPCLFHPPPSWSLVSISPSTVTQVVSTSGFPVRNWFVSRVQKHRGGLHRNTVLPGWEKKNPLRTKISHGKKNLREKIWWQPILPDGNERKKWGEVLELRSWKLGFCLETVEKMTQTHSLKLTYTPENGWLEDYFLFWEGLFSSAMLVWGNPIPLKWWF